MAKVRLITEVEPELSRQVEIAASESDRSVSEWIEYVLGVAVASEHARTLDEEELTIPPAGVKPRGLENPVKLRGGKTMAETVLEDRGER